MMRFGRWLPGVLLIVLAGLGCLALLADPKGKADAFAESYNARDLATMLGNYSDDVVLQPADGPLIEGKAKVEAYFRAVFEKYPNAKLTAVTADIEQDELKMVRITVLWSMTGGGVPSFTTVSRVREDSDGQWVVFHSSWPLQSGIAAAAAGGKCVKDDDCQGEQICDQGVCADQ